MTSDLPYIGLDFDGVICNPPLGFNIGISAGEWPADIAERGVKERRGLALKLENAMAPIRYFGRKPLPNVADHLRRLGEVRRIAIITGRPVSLQGMVEAWLMRYGLLELITEVHTNSTGYRTPHFKATKAAELGAREFVEDDGRTVRYLAGMGLNVYMVDWPRNRSHYAENVTVVESLGDVATALAEAQ